MYLYMYLVPGSTMYEEWCTPYAVSSKVQDWDSRLCQYLVVSNDLTFALHLLRYAYVLPSFWLLHSNAMSVPMLIVGTDRALK
jgi:hypothetical protein